MMVCARRGLGRVLILLAGLLILTTACARRQVEPAFRSGQGGVAPVLVVERFLNAVNSKDLDSMARLFGTRDGSVLKRDPHTEVEARMYAIASLLRHEGYQMEGEGIVPGRLGEAVRYLVLLKLEDREVSVPFVVVRTRKSGWLIEKIGIDRITAGGSY